MNDKPMFYPCSDGINRDMEIARYHSLFEQSANLQKEELDLERRKQERLREMSRLSERIGNVGIQAMRDKLGRTSKREDKYYATSTHIDFGQKHPGKTIGEILEVDPEYISWCIDEVEWFVPEDGLEDKAAERFYEMERDAGTYDTPQPDAPHWSDR